MATQDRPLNFGLLQHMKWFLCRDDIEDDDHLFFGCPYSFRVWHSIMSKCDSVPPFASSLGMAQWVCIEFRGPSLLSTIGKLSISAAVYFLWRERNSHKNDGLHKNILHLIDLIMNSVRLKLLDCSGYPRTSFNLHLVRVWHLSPTLVGG